MRVRVSYTVEVTDKERLAIAAERDMLEPQYTADGRVFLPGQRLAKREEVRDFYETYGLGSEGMVNDWLTLIDQSNDTLGTYLRAGE